jgi:hypothetical protein
LLCLDGSLLNLHCLGVRGDDILVHFHDRRVTGLAFWFG